MWCVSDVTGVPRAVGHREKLLELTLSRIDYFRECRHRVARLVSGLSMIPSCLSAFAFVRLIRLRSICAGVFSSRVTFSPASVTMVICSTRKSPQIRSHVTSRDEKDYSLWSEFEPTDGGMCESVLVTTQV
ncbi:MAG: hypothetical protein A07HR60_02329 [uncultured archaeon A07HR60]|nr:MAG: hypothetical protein A07HR60_02329 [uncultured archaeon A07HR60]